MKYIKIDNTDLEVSRIAFGTGSLHHLFWQKQRLQLLDKAFEVGITHFDTSPYYGYGLAETDLGLFIKDRRNSVTIATKVGLYSPGPTYGALGVWIRKAAGKFHESTSLPKINWSVKVAENSLNTSLKRLKSDYVDILFLHEPDISLINSDEFLSWLEKERANGKVRYFGLAGNLELLKKWISSNHPLAGIIQTKDSLVNKEADYILNCNRRLQFTYGYLSCQNSIIEESAEALFSKALNRNIDGSILFSTRRLERIEKIIRSLQ